MPRISTPTPEPPRRLELFRGQRVTDGAHMDGVVAAGTRAIALDQLPASLAHRTLEASLHNLTLAIGHPAMQRLPDNRDLDDTDGRGRSLLSPAVVANLTPALDLFRGLGNGSIVGGILRSTSAAGTTQLKHAADGSYSIDSDAAALVDRLITPEVDALLAAGLKWAPQLAGSTEPVVLAKAIGSARGWIFDQLQPAYPEEANLGRRRADAAFTIPAQLAGWKVLVEVDSVRSRSYTGHATGTVATDPEVDMQKNLAVLNLPRTALLRIDGDAFKALTGPKLMVVLGEILSKVIDQDPTRGATYTWTDDNRRMTSVGPALSWKRRNVCQSFTGRLYQLAS